MNIQKVQKIIDPAISNIIDQIEESNVEIKITMLRAIINSSLNNRIWRVDVGASRAFGKLTGPDAEHRLAQVLVILNDGRNAETDFQIVKERSDIN